MKVLEQTKRRVLFLCKGRVKAIRHHVRRFKSFRYVNNRTLYTLFTMSGNIWTIISIM